MRRKSVDMYSETIRGITGWCQLDIQNQCIDYARGKGQHWVWLDTGTPASSEAGEQQNYFNDVTDQLGSTRLTCLCLSLAQGFDPAAKMGLVKTSLLRRP